MPNDTTPEAIEEEKTVPVPALTLAEQVRQPRRPYVDPSLIDGLNGVDDRGGW